MKKAILLSALALVASSALASSPSELRIYINPGHGGWTGNDRPMQIIGHKEYSKTNTDTTGFFESNTNLIKGFGVLEKLIEAGFPFDRTKNQTGERWEIGAAKDLKQNLVMSRVKNGPYWAVNDRDQDGWDVYNRQLYEIAAEVEYNDFDEFISIHSNATGEGSATNYPIFMYRGTNGKSGVAVEGSWEMSEAAWPYTQGQEHMCWSSKSTYIVGDLNWMGGGPDSGTTSSLGYYGYLGVLKHGVPGYLVEGYFHTYQPGRHRAMNFDADLIEGYQYARGVLDYFGLEKTKTGEIYGIVRDAHEKFAHKLYNAAPRSDDQYLPLNGCKVYLKKDGTQIAEYLTDENYNGGFVFIGLQPGTYTLEFEMADYKKTDPVEVEVKANLTSYPKVFLENVNYTQGVNMDVNYPDPLSGGPFGPADSYDLTQTYVDQPIAELEGKTVRRAILRNGRLYLLALDAEKAPTLLVYDPVAQAVLTTLSTEGCEGTELALSDIQVTADGYLIGCAKELNHYDDSRVQAGETRGEQWFYKWANDPQTGLPVGAPKKWNSFTSTGLWYRSYVGDTFAYSGSTEDGLIAVSCPTVSEGRQLRYEVIAVTGDKFSGSSPIKPYRYLHGEGHYFYGDELGEGYRFVTAPYNDGKFLIIGSGEIQPVLEFSFTDQDLPASPQAQEFMPSAKLNTEIVASTVEGINFFNYSDRCYMVVADMAEGSVGGVKLFDVTDGIAEPKLVGTSNTAVEAAAAGRYVTLGCNAAKLSEDGDVLSADLALYLLRDGKLSRFTTEGVEQPATRGSYAYGLAMTADDTKVTFTFKLSGDVDAATVVLTDTESDATIEVPTDAKTAGEYTATLERTQLDSNKKYNWAVSVEAPAVRNTGLVYTAEANAKSSRGGVTWINDTESDNYGRIVVTQGFAQGIDVYSPTLEREGRYFVGAKPFVASKVNSPYRVGTREGKAYIVDWSDAGAGYWIFDPSNPDTITDFMEGENNGTGAHVVDGKVIGGGSTCVGFLGTGEDTKMYSFVEDYPEGNAKTWGLQRYDIGTAQSLAVAPTMSFDNISSASLMTGTNVEVCPVDNGLFVSQARAVGNNIADSPCFIYITPEGKVLFNSYALGDNLDSSGSGIAVNAERNLIAIAEKQTGIGLWSLSWDEEGVPVFNKKYIIPGSTGADEVNQLVFDVAGNLYAFHRAAEGFKAYTVRRDAKTIVTPAKSSEVISAGMDGIESVALGTAVQGAAEYFNLQGQRVSADNLVPGIYVVRNGREARKVVIR